MDLIANCQNSLEVLITAADVGTSNIYKGGAAADMETPSVRISASNLQEEPVGTGNFQVDLTVEVWVGLNVKQGETASDRETAAAVIWDNVLGVLEVDDLAEQMTAADDNLTVFGFMEGKTLDSDQGGDATVMSWKRRAYACAMAFS